jgi:hypothetical protein
LGRACGDLDARRERAGDEWWRSGALSGDVRRWGQVQEGAGRSDGAPRFFIPPGLARWVEGPLGRELVVDASRGVGSVGLCPMGARGGVPSIE